MYKLGLSEAGHSISDKPFIKKSHPLINKNVSPQGHVLSSNVQDSKILCKRIDNSTLNVPTKNEQEALGQKFVPLAFPLEKMKKKTTHSQSQAVSQESKSKNTSVPHSVNISGQPSRNQSMPQVLGKAPNASGYNLTFNLAEAGNLPEPKGLKAIKKSKANQSMEEIPKASSIEYGERTTSPLKSKENKVLKLRKKSAKKSSGNIKKAAKENIVVGDMRPKSRMSVGGQLERENEEGKIKHKPSEEKIMKSAKGSKNSSPTKSQIEKKEKRKVKKREQVSKSEIPAAFEEMIQKSAQEYMEDLRAKKHMSDLEKIMYEEKKAALEQGNKMIRISNLQRFNPPPNHQESMDELQPRFAWGVDQRKFDKKNERQGSKTPPPRKKIDDRERRKVIGLDHFDESRLQQRKSVKEKNTSQREASEEKKSKRELDKGEHAKIQEYMYQKRAKIEQQKHEKQNEADEEFDRKRRNLEQLFFEIRYNREKESKKSKSKKRLKSRKTHKSSLSPARVSQREDLVRKGESMIYHQHEINEINEENYQALYNEYMNIRNAKTKKKSRDVSPNDRSSTRNKHRNQSVEIYREEQSDMADHYQHSSGRNVRESQRLKAKYHEIKQRESDVSGEYTSQNTLNRNPLESSPHKTTQKEVSPIKKKKKEKVVYDENKVKKSRRSQQLTGSDAQDIIIEMETDNFSDNDNLRSERMIIRDRYERPIIEEEDFSNPGFRTYDNIPIESTREVMEAAAIFIQKNYRGYRTRKLIKMYFDQICREGLDFTDEEEERHADEDEDDVDNRYENQRRKAQQQQELIKVQDERYSSHKGKKQQQPYEESSEEEEEEEETGRNKDHFLDPNEKKSIYDLLERQKRLIGQEESDQQISSKRQEGEDEDEYYERKLREIQAKIDAGEKLTYEEVSSAKQSDLDSQLAKADYMKYLEQLGQMKGPGSESEDFKQQSQGADSQEIDSEQYYQQMEYLRFREQIHSQLVGMKEKYGGSPDLKEGERDLRRIKSDGERGAQQGAEEVYGDTEDSDQISLHHDYMRNNFMGSGGRIPQDYRSNNDIPKNSVSVSERDTGSYAEEFRSSMPEATPVKEGYSHSATKQGSDHNQLVQVPTVESMTIPTKSVIESQLFMNPSIQKEFNKGKEVDYSLGNMDLSTSQAQVAQKRDTQALTQIKSGSSVQSNVIGPQSKKSSDSKQTSSGRRAGENISSKKTPENVLLDKRKISFPVQESSDSSRKKTLTKSESDQFRDQLISELKAMEEEKSDHKIKQKAPGKETLIDNFVNNNNKPLRKIKQIEKSSSGSRQDRELDYQNELVRLREEQARQWNDVLKQLNALKTEENTELNEKVREFIENLASQSEINRRRLIDSVELQNIIKTQSGQSDEKSIINDLDSLMKNNQYTLPTENQVTVQTPKEDDLVVVKETQGSAKRDKKEKSSSSEKKTSTKKKRFEFGKKNNLEINVELVNDEKTEQGNIQAAAEAAGLEGVNLDLSQIRMALGSEQLIREQSQRTLTQSISTPSELGSLNNLKTPDNMDSLVNLFGRDPFQEFANKRFKELMSQDSMKQLIQMREQALEVRHKAHIETINKMFENRKFSPRTFQNKKIELEKWVNKERDNIQKSRKDIEKGWTSTQDSIKKTQRDLEFLNKVAAHSGSKSSAQKIDERSIEPSNRTATKDLTRSPIAKFILPEDSIQSESSKKNREDESGLRYIDDIQLGLRSPPGEKNKTPNKFSPSARSASKYDTIKSDSSYPGTRTEDLTIDTTEIGSKEIRQRKPISPHIESDNTGSSKYLNQSESVIETTNVGFDNKFISSRLSTQKEDKPLEIPSRISPQNANKAKERRNKLAPLEPEGHEAAVVSLTPKTPQELRNLFNEQVEALKASTSNPDLTQKVLEEAVSKQTSQKNLETVDGEVNLQKKVDMITEEVFNSLFDELGKELGKPEKERVAGKVKGIDDHNPVLGKQQLAENKEFFTHGAEKHHNFQANIAIIPAAIVEHEKLDEVHDIIKEEERIYDELERYENLYDQGVIRENNSSQPIKSDEHEKLLDDDQIKQQQQQQVLFDTQAEIFRNLAIKTDLKSLENYLDMLLAEIKGSYMDEFLTNINIPIGLNIGEKLNNMHAYDLAGSESSLEMSDGLQRAILSIHLYLKVEEALMEQNPSRNEVITELEHIHNKMVFDCLNEILDFYRPHGLVGEPYPWKLSVRVQKPATITKSHVEKILRECKKKVMEWAAFMCGYYGERDDFIRDRTNSYAEEYLAQIKEERLSKMLAAEVYEMEDKWINYDDEEAEVELEISDLVFDKLVTETAELIMRINEQRGGPKRPSPERKLKMSQDEKKKRKKSL